MEIGKRIKEIRESISMTQSELADKLDLSVHTISKYEQGQRKPKLDMLKEIAEALEVNVADLVEGATEEELSKAAVFQMASSELKKDISYFIESIFHRFGIVSSYRDNDTKYVYVTYNLKTYKINNQKYEAMKAHIMNLFEGQIINLLELLDESAFNPTQDPYITTEDRQKKAEQVHDFEVLEQFNKEADKLFKSYMNKEGE